MKFKVLCDESTVVHLYTVHLPREAVDSLAKSADADGAVCQHLCCDLLGDVCSLAPPSLPEGLFSFSSSSITRNLLQWKSLFAPPTLMDCDEDDEAAEDELISCFMDFPIVEVPPCCRDQLEDGEAYVSEPWAMCLRALQVILAKSDDKFAVDAVAAAEEPDDVRQTEIVSSSWGPLIIENFAVDIDTSMPKSISDFFSKWKGPVQSSPAAVFSDEENCEALDAEKGEECCFDGGFLSVVPTLIKCELSWESDCLVETASRLLSAAAGGGGGVLPPNISAKDDSLVVCPKPVLTLCNEKSSEVLLVAFRAAHGNGGAWVIPKIIDEYCDSMTRTIADQSELDSEPGADRHLLAMTPSDACRGSDRSQDVVASMLASSLTSVSWRLDGPLMHETAADMTTSSAAEHHDLVQRILPPNVTSSSQLQRQYFAGPSNYFTLPPLRMSPPAPAGAAATSTPKVKKMKRLQLIRQDRTCDVVYPPQNERHDYRDACRVVMSLFTTTKSAMPAALLSFQNQSGRTFVTKPREGQILPSLASERAALAASIHTRYDDDEQLDRRPKQQTPSCGNGGESRAALTDGTDLFLFECLRGLERDKDVGEDAGSPVRCFNNGVLVDLWESPQNMTTVVDHYVGQEGGFPLLSAQWAECAENGDVAQDETYRLQSLTRGQAQIIARILAPPIVRSLEPRSCVDEANKSEDEAAAVIVSLMPFTLWPTLWRICQAVAAEQHEECRRGVLFLVPSIQDARSVHKLFVSCADWSSLAQPLEVLVATQPFADGIRVSPSILHPHRLFHGPTCEAAPDPLQDRHGHVRYVVALIVLTSAAAVSTSLPYQGSASASLLLPCAMATPGDAALALSTMLSSPVAMRCASRSVLLVVGHTASKLWAGAVAMLTSSASSRQPIRSFLIEGVASSSSPSQLACGGNNSKFEEDSRRDRAEGGNVITHILSGNPSPAEAVFLGLIERFTLSVAEQLHTLIASYSSIFPCEIFGPLLREKNARALSNGFQILRESLAGSSSAATRNTVDHANVLSQTLVLLADVEDSITIDGIRITIELLQSIPSSSSSSSSSSVAPPAASSPAAHQQRQLVYSLAAQILESCRVAWSPAQHNRSILDVEKVAAVIQWTSSLSSLVEASSSFRALILCAGRIMANAVARSLGPNGLSSTSSSSSPFGLASVAIGYFQPQPNGEMDLEIVAGFHCASYDCVVLWETLEARVVPPLFFSGGFGRESPHLVLSTVAELRNCTNVLSFAENAVNSFGGCGSSSSAMARRSLFGLCPGSLFPCARLLQAFDGPIFDASGESSSRSEHKPGLAAVARQPLNESASCNATRHVAGTACSPVTLSTSRVHDLQPPSSRAPAVRAASRPVHVDKRVTVKVCDPSLTASSSNKSIFPSVSYPIAIVMSHPGLPTCSLACFDEAAMMGCLLLNRYVFNLLAKNAQWLAQRGLAEESAMLQQQFLHERCCRGVCLVIDVDEWNDLEMEAVEGYASHLSNVDCVPPVCVEYVSGKDCGGVEAKLVDLMLAKLCSLLHKMT